MKEGVACFFECFVEDRTAFGCQVGVDLKPCVIIKERVHCLVGYRIRIGNWFGVGNGSGRTFPIRRQRTRQLHHGGVFGEFGRFAIVVRGHILRDDRDLIDC
jgi:hypothetical protein